MVTGYAPVPPTKSYAPAASLCWIIYYCFMLTETVKT
jgi:hypothetical protein